MTIKSGSKLFRAVSDDDLQELKELSFAIYLQDNYSIGISQLPC